MSSYHFGYWVFGKDMNNVDLQNLKKKGVTDLFLNYYAFKSNGESKVKSWIKKAKENNISVHIWVQCFYDGEWINPVKTDMTYKIKEIVKYTKIDGVKGIHLDYLRFPGNAYKTSNASKAITNFVKKVKSNIPSSMMLSCAVMSEKSTEYYYGQDIEGLSKIVDVIIPMSYKGNYNGNTEWLKDITKYFTSKATIWTGLQSYKSDDDTTLLSSSVLSNDIKTCLDNKAKGVILFRYGLSNNIDFNQFEKKSNSDNMVKISESEIKTLASTVKSYIEKNKTFSADITVNNKKYNYGKVAYILCYAVNNIGKSLEVITVKNADKTVCDSINENITKEDYKDIAKRGFNYMKQNGQCPNYITTKKSKKKISPRVFIYMMARIIVYYYNNNKKMPNYANVNSAYFKSSSSSSNASSTTKTECKNPYKAIPYNSKSSCDAMGQNTGYYCGCSMLQKMFYRLGYSVSQSEIARVAGTTTAGTGHDGLETAIAYAGRKFGVKFKVTWKSFSDLGFEGMGKLMCKENTAVGNHLLYRNQYGHYEYPLTVNVTNKTIKVINSLGSMCTSSCYCGYIEERSWSTHRSYINGISQKSVLIIEKV